MKSTTLFGSKPITRNQIFNVQVSEEENVRLLRLAKRVSPRTKAEAFRLAIKILEALIYEHDEGSELYIKRVSDDEPVKFEDLLITEE